jgi:DNA polymerase-1
MTNFPVPPAPPNPFTTPLVEHPGMPAPPVAPAMTPPPITVKQRLLLFDFSNLAYQALFAATRTPEALEKEWDGHYRIFISKVQSLLAKMSDANCELVFVLDSFPQAKKDIYPEYKEGRKKFDFDPKRGLLSALSNVVEFKIAKIKGYEADDVIGSLVAKNPDKQCVVISSDKDLWYLMKYDNCNVYSLYKNEYVTHEMFVEEFRIVNYHHLTLVKALWGDSSDNIPNISKATQKTMVPIINQTDGTLASLMEKFEENKLKSDEKGKPVVPQTVVAKWEQNIDQMIDNYTLVGLNCNLDVVTHPYVRGLEYQL